VTNKRISKSIQGVNMFKKLLKGLSCVALVCVLAHCGKDGRDGQDGDSNPPGEKPETPTPLPEGPGVPEQPGEGGVIKTTILCKVKWDLAGEPKGRFYNIEYNVVKETSASLKVSYTANGETLNETPITVTWGADSVMPDDAPLVGILWKASLLSDDKAKIERRHSGETKEIVCE
jgi:hypothetical protein